MAPLEIESLGISGDSNAGWARAGSHVVTPTTRPRTSINGRHRRTSIGRPFPSSIVPFPGRCSNESPGTASPLICREQPAASRRGKATGESCQTCRRPMRCPSRAALRLPRGRVPRRPSGPDGSWRWHCSGTWRRNQGPQARGRSPRLRLLPGTRRHRLLRRLPNRLRHSPPVIRPHLTLAACPPDTRHLQVLLLGLRFVRSSPTRT